MQIASNWNDYAILDTGYGEKIEQWGDYILRRPDPQVIWPWQKDEKVRNNVHAIYHRSARGGGEWEKLRKLPDSWAIGYKNLKFKVEPTGFKHTGLFPEQAVNWDWMKDKIKNANREIKVLNLFAYTGGATLACALAGASVCHVDASKGIVSWCKENAALSGLSEKPIRYIVDDCMTFIEREVRRGKTYEAIIMDPPSYGRGPKGELWKIEDELYKLLDSCVPLLSENPLFVLVNSYTTGFSPYVPANIMEMTIQRKVRGKVSAGEVGLPVKDSSIVLPCGIYTRWERGQI
ncbi:MAG: class I SAM-dependent methyltransferase [Ruminiclostridium sp.]|nr:class I SAM-dependent methyltransferase [Ruminiclostridium sp.]